MKQDFKDFMIAERHEESLIEARADYIQEQTQVLFKQQLDEILKEQVKEGNTSGILDNEEGYRISWTLNDFRTGKAHSQDKETLMRAEIQEIVKKEIQANQEGDRCAFCPDGIGEVPIQDADTHRTLWVCEKCDSEMFDNSLEKMENALK